MNILINIRNENKKILNFNSRFTVDSAIGKTILHAL